MQEQGPSLALSLPEDQLPLLRDGLAEIAELRPKLLALPAPTCTPTCSATTCCSKAAT